MHADPDFKIRVPRLIPQNIGNQSLKLLDRVREKIRLKHYSIRTEQAYIDWIGRFILFHNKRHPDFGQPAE